MDYLELAKEVLQDQTSEGRKRTESAMGRLWEIEDVCDMCECSLTEENRDHSHPTMCKNCVWDLRCEEC